MTLSLGSWVMCYAHCLTERNIRVKFIENQTKGSGDMERTRKCYGWTDRLTDKGHSYNPPFHFAAED